MKLSFGYRTDAGLVRPNNEDAYSFDLLDPRGNAALLMVADGMGGYEGGEHASELAIATVRERVLGRAADLAEQGALTKGLADAIVAANRAILTAQDTNPQRRNMGTTMTAVLIWGDRLYLGHVGDSRAYLVRKGQVEQLSLDHNVPGELVRSGHLTEAEAAVHPQRHILTRVLGMEESVAVQSFEATWGPGDVLLLCTDGLTNLVRPEELQEAVGGTDLQAATQALVDLALQRGGTDNITAVAARREG